MPRNISFELQSSSSSLERVLSLSWWLSRRLMDLIDRNLVIVSYKRKSNGAVKACTLHDLVRELCLRKAQDEGFIIETESPILSSSVITPPYKPVRMIINKNFDIPGSSAQNLRSIILFSRNFGVPLSDYTGKYLCLFVLLRVLDLQNFSLNDFPRGMELLVHLRYLAIRKDSGGFASSICNLWGLQTLIYISNKYYDIVLPRNLSDLVNLRYLGNYVPSILENDQSLRRPFVLHSIEKPMNLRTISNVELGDDVGNFQNCFPCVKELTCTTYRDEECDFKSLTCLEKLKLIDFRRRRKNCIKFPATLRALTLVRCHLPWSHMSIIQSLHNLQVLKLHCKAFEGSCWNTDGQEFRQLKFLRLDWLDIKQWEVYSTSFPCLRKLENNRCFDLEDIPIEIGDIPTLQLIRIDKCSESVNESVRRIQEVQNDLGNYDLKIDIVGYSWS